MLASGFTAAPVSKLVFFGIIASSIVASITDTKYYFYIQAVPHLVRYGQIWRLLVWQLCYTNSTELLFAAMTIYHMRIIERLWGSRKFAVCLLACQYLYALVVSMGPIDFLTIFIVVPPIHLFTNNRPCSTFPDRPSPLNLSHLESPSCGPHASHLCPHGAVPCRHSHNL